MVCCSVGKLTDFSFDGKAEIADYASVLRQCVKNFALALDRVNALHLRSRVPFGMDGTTRLPCKVSQAEKWAACPFEKYQANVGYPILKRPPR